MVDEVQADIPAEETETEELQTVVETQEEQDEKPEIETDGGDESEEVEIVLGSVEQPSTEQKARKPKGVKRLLAKNKEKDEEINRLRAQLEASQAPQTIPQATQSPTTAPTLESCGYDSDVLAQEQQRYVDSSITRALDERDNGTNRARLEAKQNKAIESHYERAEKLNLPDYDAVEGQLIDILDQNAVAQIAQVVPNSEALVYFLGKNPDQAYRIRDIWEQDPSQVLFELGGLSKDLKIVPKRNKQRPAPESKVTGASPTSKTSLEKEIDKERERIANGETNDMTHLHRLKGDLRRASAN